MTVTVVVLVLAAAVAAALGWTWQRGTGTVRPGTLERVEPDHVALPEQAFGREATMLLFTSQQDDRTAPVRAALADLQRPGVRIAEVDLTARGDLAGRYAVTRTPSVLVLDADRRLRTRVKGPAEPAVLRDALERALDGPPRPRG
ncbi:hypothetical protein [Amnibacterium endophyticum]|uniref:Thioredoxin n=1 Tax=Amnibacterium endophyticum TaxID=2109337 RepID=A0ABW4LEB5_9MICO